MDEHAAFETQAVLPPRRRRTNAIGIGVAGLAVAGLIAVGVLGGLTNKAAPVAVVPAEASGGSPTDAAVDVSTPGPSAAPQPAYPTDVFGLQVWSAAYV
jgi:hypothetical protein